MRLSGSDWPGDCDFIGCKENCNDVQPHPNAENMGLIHAQLNKLLVDVMKLKKALRKLGVQI